jgi:hypothetical protein
MTFRFDDPLAAREFRALHDMPSSATENPMTPPHATAAWPRGISEQIPTDQLLSITSLSDVEAGEVIEGVRNLPSSLTRACELIVNSWTELDGPGRLAALVALAEALASQCSRLG